ncbi:hypothetical protein GLOTRDRAFT_120633 [Gloeophyllum trabeum ATCC 11539]|uniref:Uncharacterized protein n=1 Tax=Gloeophyllum trabeum (strain ATCC 11539 / FP-39264 / Madison 617) TaxID=670483 RepID=S7QDR2_GLOTA|nr:uncharacterized protein GLOTRDRAFT_120633 [Gloeophyllum trabeum ATCC 11539]EPQ57472.1 hypothetical protein GLOTRDRAFT_120633 [Gloeophyllum trabeum ATCC 11539]
MPQKMQRPGMTRTHSRSSSGGSSKLALNLQFTQKDQLPPKFTDKTKKNGLVHHEPQQRTTSPFPRTNSKQRVRSREHIQPLALKKHAPLPHDLKPRGGKHKVDFSIASPSSDDDEDEWVSSGQVSREDSDAESDKASQVVKTPIAAEPPQRLPSPPPQPRIESPRPQPPPQLPKVDTPGLATPRAESSLSRVPTAQPNDSLAKAPPARVPSAPPRYEQSEGQLVDERSKTPTSPHRPRPQSTSKRQSMSRPPSMYSVGSRDGSLRPHPLIRGHSYGQGKPAPLAPLTTVTADTASAKLSSSVSPPSSAVGKFTSSPSSPESLRSPSQASLRRTSISSARSVNTLPGTAAPSHTAGRSGHDRNRTLSTISSSSTGSMAALSSLAHNHLPPASRPATPSYISHFPPPPPNIESIHPLLPPPYLSTHLTVVAYRNPIQESFDRVVRAKQQMAR